MLSINAAKAFEYGEGFKGLKMKGSEQNDVFYNNNGRIETHTNHSGGIQGGLSNGQDIYFRVVFKPIATLLMEQETVNIDGIDTTLKARGRHDACVLPRAGYHARNRFACGRTSAATVVTDSVLHCVRVISV